MEDAKKSQRAIIYFLWKEGVKTCEIVPRLRAVFGENAETKSTVYRWVERFKSGRTTIEDDPRSGRPNTAINKESVKAVEKIVEQNERVSIRKVAKDVGISTRKVHEILHDCLGVSKVAEKWVPQLIGHEMTEKSSTEEDEIDLPSPVKKKKRKSGSKNTT